MTEHYRSFLGLNITDCLLLRSPAVCLASDSVIRRRILLVLGQARANVEVCSLVFCLAANLALASSSFTSTCQLLKSRLRVVHRRVLPQDKVGTPELSHLSLALVVSVEFSALLVSGTNLLLQADVRHFL